MTDRVTKLLWQRGRWEVWYAQWCNMSSACNSLLGGPIIFAHRRGYDGARKHWHTRRFWSRNRTTAECLTLAIQWVLNEEAQQRRAELEAEVCVEEATALAEIASEIALP